MSIKEKFTKAIGKASLKLKAASPTILVVAGVAGLIGAGVVACKATLELEEIIDDHKEMTQKVKDAQDGLIDLKEGTEYTDEMAKKDIRTIYIQTGAKIIKVYGPSLILALLSVLSILGGHNILKKRHIAAVAEAYGVRQTLKEYRKRVANKLGDEAEKLLFVDGEKRLITEEFVDEETGEVKSVTKDVIVGNKKTNYNDPYCFIFDECNAVHTWSRTPGYNYSFLINQQNWANDYLRTHGFITLNQVLVALGLEETSEGMTIGWMIDNPNGYGDNYVDFGIVHGDNMDDPGCFSGGIPDYILNFNCDGDIQKPLAEKQAKEMAKKKSTKKNRKVVAHVS